MCPELLCSHHLSLALQRGQDVCAWSGEGGGKGDDEGKHVLFSCLKGRDRT